MKVTGNSRDTKLANIGEYAEDMFDFSKNKQWNKADKFLSRMRSSYSGLSGETGQGFIQKLGGKIETLAQSIAARNSLQSMQQTNQITLDTAKFTARISAPVPRTVTLLDYYGRELEFGAISGQSLIVNDSVSNIRKTWDAVRSSVLDRDGQTAARTFEGVVKRLEVNQSFSKYGRLAIQVLDEVDILEQVFLQPSDGEIND